MQILTTSRLSLRQLQTSDADFILQLLNERDFLRYIGDRNVRTIEDACAYIVDGPMISYRQHGFGLWLVQLKTDATPIGMCGLLKRQSLADVDIGFAFLEPFRAQGYALEAARATLTYAREVLKIARVVAIASPDNEASIRLLEKLGLRFDRSLTTPGHESPTQLFVPA